MFGSPEDEIGKIISGRYQIEQLLGRGGMSTVYRAFDQNLKRQVAIKFIHAHLSEDPEFVDRFEQEATAVANLRHPNIYQIYDSSREGRVYYMVMEYVPGKTLEEEIALRAREQRRFSLDETLNIMIPTCRAVHYAHEQGMIHRDLKPSNIMIDERSVPILMDFGVAKLLDRGGTSQTATGVTLGTGAYMAPEQATGADPDVRMDIYSMGVILFELLAGEPPFYSDSVITLMMKHINEPVPNLRITRNHLPEIIIQITENALSKTPALRYQTAKEMVDDLNTLVHGSSAALPTIKPDQFKPVQGTDSELLNTVPLPTSSSENPVVSPTPNINDTISDPVIPILETGVMPAVVSKLEPPTADLPLVEPPVSVPAGPAGPVPAQARQSSSRSMLIGIIGTLLVLAMGAGIYYSFFNGTPDEVIQTEPTLLAETIEPAQILEAIEPVVEQISVPPTRATSANMVQIPAGDYSVGVAEPSNDQASIRDVTINSFWIDQFEATNAEYADFLKTDSGEPPSSWTSRQAPAGEENLPVSGLTFESADAYCQAQSKQLPTEAQWEIAARGPEGFIYPWGNSADGVELPRSATYPVGTQAGNRSPFGVYDMAGNVWEWVDIPYEAVESGQRVLRGGQFGLVRDATTRLIGDPNQPSIFRTAGVRCVASDVEVIAGPIAEDWRAKNDLFGLTIKDEFVDPDSGWPEFSDGVMLFGYHPPDYYHVQLSAPNETTTAFSGANLASFTAESDIFVEAAGGETGNFDYGLAFRRQGENYYTFSINPRTQDWFVQQVTDSEVIYLAGGNNPSILGGQEINRLRVDANGPQIVLSLNGEPISYIENATLNEGDLGFYIRTGDEEFIHIHYDALSIRQAELPADDVLAELGKPVEQKVEETRSILPSAANMVPIDAGNYQVGGDLELNMDISSFWIDRLETTNNQYAEFIAETGHPAPVNWDGTTYPLEQENHPVEGLTFDDADAYCTWANKRLPTEIEWEIVARGPNGSLYPWGDSKELVSLPRSETYPVGSVLENRSFFGAADMAGNVWEWVAEPYAAIGDTERVLRGGSNNFQNDMTFRAVGEPTNTTMFTNAGVRCAADSVSEEANIDSRTLLEDGFADIESGWWQASAPVGPYFYGYHPTDFYHVQVSAADSCLSVFQPFEPDSFIAEVEIFVADTDSDTGNFQYGLTTRQTGAGFYAFAISPRAQTWHILKNSSRGVEEIIAGEILTLNGDSQENRDRIAVIAQDSTFAFFVNGELVGRVSDDSFSNGDIGFYVENFDETYSHIHYDKISVQALPESAQLPSEPPLTAPYSIVSPVCSGSVVTDQTLIGFVSHEVRAGEILTTIAETYGVTIEEILAANGKSIDDPSVIRPGQTIVIPQS
ncbi:MAG: SUMF1/EgtB/PvdO family nonheme iron enzyme [Anaerolineae bacterium]